MYRLSPSLLSADFARTGEQLAILEKTGVRWIHVDVMDGHFVKPISFGEPVITSLRKCTKLYFDVHLMVEKPAKYIPTMKAAGAEMFTFHAEASDDLHGMIRAIREAGMQAGVAVSPDTSPDVLDDVLREADMFLVMSVYPGFGGQKYIEAMTEKIAALRAKLDAAGCSGTPIQVDGGITVDNVETPLNAGASIIVAGSAVFRGDIAANAAALLEKVEKGREGEISQNA